MQFQEGMKHTEQEIIELAKQTMAYIGWTYDKEEPLNAIFEDKQKEIDDARQFIKDDAKRCQYIETLRNYWVVGFSFEPEAELELNKMFLEIDDDTGEPYQISHKQAVLSIVKDAKGAYKVQDPR